jgi:outer membrane lipoprotein-sorting protein
MSTRILYLAILSITALVLSSSTVASAQSAKEILEKVDKSAFVKSSRAEMIQMVVTPSGDKRSFKMVAYSTNGNEKGMTEYVAPNQVRGMKILTLNDGDDIWTYFPRTNRTRKIASSARNRKVQGSDFTYDDMATGKLAQDWKGKVVGSEKIGGKSCFKLEATPTESGPKSYSKVFIWVNKSDYTVPRIEYYDEDGDKLKVLDITDYRKISGVLFPFKYVMTNLVDGGKTLMKVDKAEINVNLDPALFTEAALGK